MNAKFGFLMFSITLLAACQSTPEYTFTTADAQNAVDNYIMCDECWNHQLYHVVIAKEQTQPILADLVDNPQNALSRNFTSNLAARYGTLKMKFPGITISEADYIAVHRGAHENRIRARAAIALNLMDNHKMPDVEVLRLRTLR